MPTSDHIGEAMPPAWWEAEALAEELTVGDVLLVVGTSLLVEPARTIPEIALRNGCHVIEVGDTHTHTHTHTLGAHVSSCRDTFATA